MVYKAIKKRRRLALTDYSKRIAMLKSDLPRMVVRRSNRGILAQVVVFQPEGDRVLTSVSSKMLGKFDWQPRSNTPTAYLTGLMLAKRAKKLEIKELVLDIGLSKPGRSAVAFAAAKGAADGGLPVLNGITIDEKRLRGGHIADYAKSIKGKPEAVRQFSGYAEQKVDPEKIGEMFENAKKKIMAAETTMLK